MILAGFKSRWMIPFSCAASSASMIWRAIARASASGMALATSRTRKGSSIDELEDKKSRAARFLEAVDGRDVRMIQRREELRFTLESGNSVRVGDEELRQDLDRDLAPELCVARAVDFAHAAGADRADD